MNTEEPLYGRTALSIAAFYGRDDVVRSLLECGARVDMEDRMGWVRY